MAAGLTMYSSSSSDSCPTTTPTTAHCCSATPPTSCSPTWPSCQVRSSSSSSNAYASLCVSCNHCHATTTNRQRTTALEVQLPPPAPPKCGASLHLLTHLLLACSLLRAPPSTPCTNCLDGQEIQALLLSPARCLQSFAVLRQPAETRSGASGLALGWCSLEQRTRHRLSLSFWHAIIQVVAVCPAVLQPALCWGLWHADQTRRVWTRPLNPHLMRTKGSRLQKKCVVRYVSTCQQLMCAWGMCCRRPTWRRSGAGGGCSHREAARWVVMCRLADVCGVVWHAECTCCCGAIRRTCLVACPFIRGATVPRAREWFAWPCVCWL
jgi:hypothetical protein